MQNSDEYWKAYERWKKVKTIKGVTALDRLTREQIYERQPQIRTKTRPR